MKIQSEKSKPRKIEALLKDQITELDVRPILNSGGEPFSQIMAAISKTSPDGALKLCAPFKPAPLFQLLKTQGWQHWIEYGEGDDWIVWFYRAEKDELIEEMTPEEMTATRLQKENAELKDRLTAKGNVWTLHVKNLAPPEPMELTLKVLEHLPKGATLVQINERVPQFLLPLLEERLFRYTITYGEAGEVRLVVNHAS